jgi:hypothetical protein
MHGVYTMQMLGLWCGADWLVVGICRVDKAPYAR